MPRRVARIFDALLTVAVALSYPLYIYCDALPRAEEVGPPVPDRYPWRLALAVLIGLGWRLRRVTACALAACAVGLAAAWAYSDDAVITGVAVHPCEVAAGALVALSVGGLARRLSE
jgi:hypothetical protein